ncbi:MAG TPA: ABC transporter permease [Chloroflexia bacterium]|jgi:peptide/nickel transport system permease protein|nr:ABC transporter permease [Chloroflexia bacterium]
MTTYFIRRFAQSIALILLVWFLMYTLLVYLMPAGPNTVYKQNLLVERRVGDRVFHQAVGTQPAELLADTYKVDRPWPFSFLFWLFDPTSTTRQDPNDAEARLPKGINVPVGEWRLQGSGVLTGDFGVSTSIRLGVDVRDIIGSRWDNTAMLVGTSLLVAVLLAVPAGIAGAMWYRGPVDHTLTFVSMSAFSIPPHALGIILIVTLAITPAIAHHYGNMPWLPYLPPGGVTSAGGDGNPWEVIYHLALPVATLALPQIAYLSRHVRASMLEVLRLEYIRTAWAKGVSRRRIMFKHAFRNACIPLVTAVGVALPSIAAGSILVETVFGYAGMGEIFFRAVGGCLAAPETYEVFCASFTGEPGRLLPMDYAGHWA